MRPESKALKNQEITFKDRIVLGPVDRYKKYGIFPWKFIIHVISLLAVSYQVMAIVTIQADFAYNSELLWYNLFMTSYDETADLGSVVKIYDIA